MKAPWWQIALWEFARFFKVRDQILTLVFAAVGGLVGFGIGKWKDAEQRTHTVAVLGREATSIPSSESVRFVPANAQRAELLKQIEDRKLSGLLEVTPSKSTLYVKGEPSWSQSVEASLTMSFQSEKLSTLGVNPNTLASALTPTKVTIVDPQTSDAARSGQRLFSTIGSGLTLFAVFLSVSYLFVGITGEKSQRVTEQIVAAIRPQAWIDGKILGVAMVALAQVLEYVVIGLTLTGVFRISAGKSFWVSIPPISAPSATAMLLFALAGFAFWLFLIGAFAATINDPQTSSRNSILFLPFLPLSVVFFGAEPDGAMMRTLSLIPFTSMSVMPARMVQGSPATWEVLLSLAILIGSTWWIRNFAGKVFGTAILMTGKEPSLKEIIRWSREAS